MYRARMATTYDTGKMAMCNTGEDGHVYVITFVTQARMAMCNTGDDGHVYVTTKDGWRCHKTWSRWVRSTTAAASRKGET